MEAARERSRSRSPRQLIMPPSWPRSRSRSPIVIAQSRRLRSRSPQRVILAGASGHSRRDSQPQPVIIAGPTESSRRDQQPIIIQGDQRDSPRPIVVEGKG
ncbi:hypothetical protein FRC15_002327 [Serendipita sp. 397]|nr:hypothetical protein FRC15_002327 [Serendipita sp. 397]